MWDSLLSLAEVCFICLEQPLKYKSLLQACFYFPSDFKRLNSSLKINSAFLYKSNIFLLLPIILFKKFFNSRKIKSVDCNHLCFFLLENQSNRLSKDNNLLFIMIFLLLTIYNKKKLIKAQRPISSPE